MANYQVVFDLRISGYRGWHPALLPFVAAGVGMLVWLLVRRLVTRNRSGYAVYLVLIGSAVTLMALVGTFLLLGTFAEYRRDTKALERGETQVVAGCVTEFVPEELDGHPIESFRVGQHAFSYSSSDVTSAFHQTASRGGPIREGSCVRITSRANAILVLEILR